jgi:hypothetical protein
MAQCRFCGEQVAWFRKEHDECLHQHNRALTAVGHLISRHLETQYSANRLHDQAIATARRGYMTVGELRNVAVRGIEHLAHEASNDHPVIQADVDRIKAVARAFGLGLADCGSAGTVLSKGPGGRAPNENEALPTVKTHRRSKLTERIVGQHQNTHAKDIQ